VAAAVLSSPGPITAFLQALSPGQNSATKVKVRKQPSAFPAMRAFKLQNPVE